MLSSTLLASPTQTSQLKTSYTPTKPSNNTKQFSKYPTKHTFSTGFNKA